MNKDRNIYLAIGLVTIALVVLFFSLETYWTQWEYNLNIKKKNAYGLFLTYQLIKEKYTPTGFEVNKDKSPKNFLARKKPGENATYMFIGDVPYFDSLSVDTLMDMVHRGSTVFLACDDVNLPFNDAVLKNKYHLEVASGSPFEIKALEKLFKSNSKPLALFNFTHPNLKRKKDYPFLQKYNSDTIYRYYMNFEAASDTEPLPVYDSLNSIVFPGYQTDLTGSKTDHNFGVFTYGKGQFIILLSSLPFTNYYTRNEAGLEYIEKVFAHIPTGLPVIWDEYSRKYHYEGGDNGHEQGNSEFGESPIYFVLHNKSLRMAWYLLLVALLIYTFFAAKRRQKIIPVMEPKANTSLQYVETIGQLYYDETEHLDIANEMRIQFFNFLRKKYFLSIQLLDEDTIPGVALKTGTDATELKKLADYFEEIRKFRSFTHEKLNDYNHILEYFYANCK